MTKHAAIALLALLVASAARADAKIAVDRLTHVGDYAVVLFTVTNAGAGAAVEVSCVVLDGSRRVAVADVPLELAAGETRTDDLTVLLSGAGATSAQCTVRPL